MAQNDIDFNETEGQELAVQSTKDNELSDEELIKVAKYRFKLAEESEEQSRIEELEDIRFMVGDQWPSDIKAQRHSEQRPCLTINRIPQFVRQITNDQRQNRPSIKVNPADDMATIETAKIYQGMIRHIEYASHADIAYDTAFEGTVKSGLGYFRIVTDYADAMSFQQEIKIKLIKDRFSVYLDPFYQEPDGSDSEWGFVFEDISKDEFRVKYPKAKLSTMASWDSVGNDYSSWVKKDSVRIAEYYYKTYEEQDIVLLSNGKSVKKSSLPNQLEDGLRVVSERKTLVPKVKWAMINGIEVLEKTEVLGQWIPIIPVVGEEEIVNGHKVVAGIIRHTKDPQRMYNYWSSAETETIALAPKAPFIGAEGQFEGFETQWKTANTKNHAYLEYKVKSLGGIPQGPPQRNVVEPPVQAITQARNLCIEDMKGTTGIYDASLGNRSNEQSGVAIQRRNTQSQTGNFHYTDNLSKSMRHGGRIILNWIPQIYNTAQAVRIIGEDGEVQMAQINKIFREAGEDKSHFLDVGNYDCTISTGPSFQTKRQEAVSSMLDLARSLPQSMQVGLDLLVRNMDWPGAQEIADRIKKTLPPNILDSDKDMKIPPQIQAQMQQMSHMVKTLSEQNAEYIEILRTKKMDIESKERIAAQDNETALRIEMMKHDAKDSQIMFQEAMAHIDRRLELLNANQPIDSGAGGDAAPQDPNIQQPTGGQPPGPSMGGNP